MPAANGPMIPAVACEAWLRPLARARCRRGTSSETEAAKEGPWTAPRATMTAMKGYTCQSLSLPASIMEASPTVITAETALEKSMILRRSHRSARAPAIGDTTRTTMPASTAIMANGVAEPVFSTTQTPREKLPRLVPRVETSWPHQRIRNGRICRKLSELSCMSSFLGAHSAGKVGGDVIGAGCPRDAGAQNLGKDLHVRHFDDRIVVAGDGVDLHAARCDGFPAEA